MNAKKILGRWRCTHVHQTQSTRSIELHGEHPDLDDEEPQDAEETEYADATLEVFDDGRYVLKTAEDFMDSFGVWEDAEGTARLRQSSECSNGYEGLNYGELQGDEFRLSFELTADAHDGLDEIELTFRRESEGKKAHQGNDDSFVQRLRRATSESKLYALLEEGLGGENATTNAREVWDEWLAGRYPGSPEESHYYLREDVFRDGRVLVHGAFRLEHAKKALALPPQELGGVAFAVESVLREGGVFEVAEEAALGEIVHEKWLRRFAHSRCTGGGLPEEFFLRPFMPQPRADEISREVLAGVERFSGFSALPHLFDVGDDALPKIVYRYRGGELVNKPLALIEERGIEMEVLEAVNSYLDDPAHRTPSDTFLGALMWSVLLSTRLGVELSKGAQAGLEIEVKYSTGSPSEAEKELLRDAAAKLPAPEGELFRKRFYL